MSRARDVPWIVLGRRAFTRNSIVATRFVEGIARGYGVCTIRNASTFLQSLSQVVRLKQPVRACLGWMTEGLLRSKEYPKWGTAYFEFSSRREREERADSIVSKCNRV